MVNAYKHKSRDIKMFMLQFENNKTKRFRKELLMNNKYKKLFETVTLPNGVSLRNRFVLAL